MRNLYTPFVPIKTPITMSTIKEEEDDTTVVHSNCTNPTPVTPSHDPTPVIPIITQEEDLPTDYTDKPEPRGSTRIWNPTTPVSIAPQAIQHVLHRAVLEQRHHFVPENFLTALYQE